MTAVAEDLQYGYGFSLEHIDWDIAMDFCEENGYDMDVTPEWNTIREETSLRLMWVLAAQLPEAMWQRLFFEKEVGIITSDSPDTIPGIKKISKALGLSKKDIGLVTYTEKGIVDIENVVKRTYYQDPYNEKKVWEVSQLEHGLYLRQFISGTQFGRGERVSKSWLNDLGILDFDVLDTSHEYKDRDYSR